jgi:dolichol-phosphate mannosyltransferase
MKFNAWKHGFRIIEVPIVFTERKEGASKMSRKIFYEAVFGVLIMKAKSLFKKYNRINQTKK